MTNLTNRFNARLAGSYYSGNPGGLLSRTVTIDDAEFEATGEVNYFQAMLLVDFLPRPWLRVSGGLALPTREGEALLVPTGDVTVGSLTFSRDQVGQLRTDASLGSWAVVPYVGMGVGNPLARSRRLRVGVQFEAGIYYHGSSSVNITAVDPNAAVAPTANPDNEEALAGYLDQFPIYPELSLGLTLRLR